jgi:hypothetical protein
MKPPVQLLCIKKHLKKSRKQPLFHLADWVYLKCFVFHIFFRFWNIYIFLIWYIGLESKSEYKIQYASYTSYTHTLRIISIIFLIVLCMEQFMYSTWRDWGNCYPLMFCTCEPSQEVDISTCSDMWTFKNFFILKYCRFSDYGMFNLCTLLIFVLYAQIICI